MAPVTDVVTTVSTVSTVDPSTMDLVLKIAKEFGVPLVILGILLYLLVYKILPDFWKRDKEKDEERTSERKYQLDIFVAQMDTLSKRNEDAFSQLRSSNENMKSSNESFKVAVDAFKESLQTQKDQNRDVISTIKDGHRSLSEDIAKSIKEDLSSIYRRIDELVKK